MAGYSDVTGYGDTWTTWTSSTTSASDISTWNSWVGSATSTSSSPLSSGEGYYRVVVPIAAPTPEQIETKRREDEAAQARRKAADERAEELLRSLLTDEQRKHLDEMTSFLVKSESQRTFRIRRGERVQELDDNGKVIAGYCIAPTGIGLPVADKMLAQKLLLENNEAEFLRIANRFAS